MSLKIINLSKSLGDLRVLRDVSFEAASGEVFGLLGANESGKTIALKIIAGLEKADAGSIFRDDRDLTDAPERGFRYIRNTFQSKDFPEDLKQKVSFEKNLSTTQSLLLLDEPFVFFDQHRRDETFEKLRRAVTEKNLTVVLALNDYEDAFAVCDRAAVLHDGAIRQIGTPRELYEKPNCVAVAAALGRCNFIEATPVSFDNQNAPEFQTVEGEHLLLTGKTDKRISDATDTPVMLAVRPEYVSISFGASFPEDNLIKAQIAAVEYRGATTRVRLDAGGLLLEALVLRLVGLNVGDECMVGLPPDRIQVLEN